MKMPGPIDENDRPGTRLYKNAPSYQEQEPSAYTPPTKEQKEAISVIREEAKQELLAPALTIQQTLFLEEYSAHGNLRRACRMAAVPYPTAKLWLEHKDYELLQAELRGMQIGQRRAHEALVAKTMGAVDDLLNADIANFAEWEDGSITIKSLEELKKNGISTKAIKSIEHTKFGVKLVLHDRVETIKTAMLGLGLINKRPAIESPEDKAGETMVSLVEALETAHKERSLKKSRSDAIDADFKIEEKS
jgi:hypothetical protein